MLLMDLTAEELQGQLKEGMEENGDDYTFANFTDSEYTGVIGTAKIDNITTYTANAIEQLNFVYSDEGGKKTYTVSGVLDGSDALGGAGESGNMGMTISDMDMKISIAMPGKIISHNATWQEGNKLIWDLASSAAVSIQATSEASSAGAASPNPAPPANEIKVILDGALLFFDVPPQIENGRTLVPLRAIFEALGAVIEWEGDTQTVTASKDGTVVVLTIGSAAPTINGQTIAIDQPGIIVNGRTLAPLRFVAEAFGGKVEWDAPTQTATITN